MTEAEWLACHDAIAMLEFLEGKASERKLRLFGAACCRRIDPALFAPAHQALVEAVELFSDNLIDENAFRAALEPVSQLWGEIESDDWEPQRYVTAAARHLETGGGAPWAAGFSARAIARQCCPEQDPQHNLIGQAEREAQSHLLREIFGTPMRPLHFDADWLAGPGQVAVKLASKIVQHGRFDEVPLLAELLEQADCPHPDGIAHCRAPGTHLRGCWVVDALLGRESPVRAGLLTRADWHACGNLVPLHRFLEGKGSVRQWRLYAVACCRRIESLIQDERSRQALEVAALLADDRAAPEEVERARTEAEVVYEAAWMNRYRAEAEADFCYTREYAAACWPEDAAEAVCWALRPDPRIAGAEARPTADEREFVPSDSCVTAARKAHWFASSAHSPGEIEEHNACETEIIGAEMAEQCALLRDIFGAYFGAPADPAAWLPLEPSLIFRRKHAWCRLPTPANTHIPADVIAWRDGLIRALAQAMYDEDSFDRVNILADGLEEAGCTNIDILDHLRAPGPHVRGCWVVDLLLGKCQPFRQTPSTDLPIV